MANIDLRFLCESRVSYSRIRRPSGDNNVVCIEIVNTDENISTSVWFDKSTAIKYAKTLRTEINKITEVQNV